MSGPGFAGDTMTGHLRRTPLEQWYVGIAGEEVGRLGLDGLAVWQAARVRETVALARERSAFYARHLAGIDPASIRGLADLARLPTTSADDLRTQGHRMVCVAAGEIERIVTLPTSGTTGDPKRVFLTQDDLGQTIDFFRAGMSTFTGAGDRVLVLMPGRRPGSIGELLQRALPQLGADVLVHGPVADVGEALAALLRFRPTVVVGIPVQVHMLACHAATVEAQIDSVRAVLLSADRAAPIMRRTIERCWGCRVYDHYGSTEMGFGGGVECESRDGFHLREADLLFEVVEPGTGHPARPGESGEVVVTTLRRTGMPLIRYRTGDVSALKTGRCPCGSWLPRLAAIEARVEGYVRLANGARLTLAQLDEVLFGVDGVTDYRVSVESADDGTERLRVVLRIAGDGGRPVDGRAVAVRSIVTEASQALQAVSKSARPSAKGPIAVDVAADDGTAWAVSTGMTKRTLVDNREMEALHA